MSKKTQEKEICYGRELFKAMGLYLPMGIQCGERTLKNGLIEIKVMRPHGKKFVGISPLIQIGADSPIKAADLKELCIEAGKKIDAMISKIEQDEM